MHRHSQLHYTFCVMKHTILRMLSQNCAMFMALYALFLLARVPLNVVSQLTVWSSENPRSTSNKIQFSDAECRLDGPFAVARTVN